MTTSVVCYYYLTALNRLSWFQLYIGFAASVTLRNDIHTGMFRHLSRIGKVHVRFTFSSILQTGTHSSSLNYSSRPFMEIQHMCSCLEGERGALIWDSYCRSKRRRRISLRSTVLLVRLLYFMVRDALKSSIFIERKYL